MNKSNIYISLLLLLIIITIVLVTCPKKQKEKYKDDKLFTIDDVLKIMCTAKSLKGGLTACAEGNEAACFTFIFMNVLKYLTPKYVPQYIYNEIKAAKYLQAIEKMSKNENFGKDLIALFCFVYGSKANISNVANSAKLTYNFIKQLIVAFPQFSIEVFRELSSDFEDLENSLSNEISSIGSSIGNSFSSVSSSFGNDFSAVNSEAKNIYSGAKKEAKKIYSGAKKEFNSIENTVSSWF